MLSLSGTTARLEFDRFDDGLPINFGLFGALQFRYVPVPEELNRYMLTVKNLSEGRYDVAADDRPLGQFTARKLAEGVNLSSATADGWEPGGPWDAQAWILKDMTEAQPAREQSSIPRPLPAGASRARGASCSRRRDQSPSRGIAAWAHQAQGVSFRGASV